MSLADGNPSKRLRAATEAIAIAKLIEIAKFRPAWWRDPNPELSREEAEALLALIEDKPA